MVRSAERLLKTLCLDGDSIRLDCTESWLFKQLNRFSVHAVHLATPAEIAGCGFLEDAIVPDRAQQLSPGDLELLAPFLADADTPSGLRLAFGEMDLTDPRVAGMLDEAARPGFRPHYGSQCSVGPYQGRLIDVLTARPDTMTTTVLDPRIPQYSENRPGTWMGMHYDNAWTTDEVGERFPCGTRVASADRRVLYNAGPGPRRLVVGLNMTSVYVSEKVRPGDKDNIPDSRQLQAYLRRNPGEVESVVCLSVRLDPGDFIVFPAAVAMHDGSMDGFSEPSSAIVLGGRF